MQVWNGLLAARCKRRTQKISPKSRHLSTILQLCRAISSQLRNVSTIRKKLLSSSISSTCPHNMVNFSPLAAEICWRLWGTPANFNGFCVFAVLLHGILVVGVSQTLRRWTEGATYIRQGSRHVEHWPTFLVISSLTCCGLYPKTMQVIWYLINPKINRSLSTLSVCWSSLTTSHCFFLI